MTDVEEHALGLLVAAGLVEVRIGLACTLPGQSQALHLTLDVTGETGWVAGLEPVLADLRVRSQPDLAAGGEDARRGILVHPIGARRWRITEQGRLGRADLNSDQEDLRAAVIRHCLRRWAILPDGGRVPVPVDPGERLSELADLPVVPVAGTVRVVDRAWVVTEASRNMPLSVEVTNWAAGAEALATALRGLVPQAAPEAGAADIDHEPYGSDPTRWTGPKKLALLRYLMKNPSARPPRRLIDEAARAGAGAPATVERYLRLLRDAGWLTESDAGTCLSEKGHRGAERIVGKNR